MQMVVFRVIYGVIGDIVRRVYGSVKLVLLETGNEENDEFILSPVAVREQNSRTRISQGRDR